jgi:hypothetical protein
LTDRLVFNHHCLPCACAEDARRYAPVFLRICLKAQALGLGTILVAEGLDANWYRLELASGYFFQDWSAVSREEDRDCWRVFLRIATAQPFFSSEEIGTDLALFDVLSPEEMRPLSVLRAAHWHDAPLVGFPTRSPWDSSPVRGIVHSISEDGEEGLSEERFDNLVSMDIFESVAPRLRAEQMRGVERASDLWDRREELFPHLDLCGKTQGQLCGWSHSVEILDQSKAALVAMERLCLDWQSGALPDYSHAALVAREVGRQVSGESPSHNQDPRARAQRTFFTSQGEKQYFEDHVKLSRGFRMHFWPDPVRRCIHVGYIGPHLR